MPQHYFDNLNQGRRELEADPDESTISIEDLLSNLFGGGRPTTPIPASNFSRGGRPVATTGAPLPIGSAPVQPVSAPTILAPLGPVKVRPPGYPDDYPRERDEDDYDRDPFAIPDGQDLPRLPAPVTSRQAPPNIAPAPMAPVTRPGDQGDTLDLISPPPTPSPPIRSGIASPQIDEDAGGFDPNSVSPVGIFNPPSPPLGIARIGSQINQKARLGGDEGGVLLDQIIQMLLGGERLQHDRRRRRAPDGN
jgi:hypothetical protein